MTVRVERRYGAAETARRLKQALEADQDRRVEARQEGDLLTFTVRADDPGSVRATVEDLLACLGAAERTLGVTPASRTPKG